MVKTYSYRGVAITIVLYLTCDNKEVCGWGVELDGECLSYYTTATGQLILGIVESQSENDLDMTTLRDPCVVTPSGVLNPFSQGAGRRLSVQDAYFVALESTPIEYIHPYIDHSLAMRALHRVNDVLEHIEQTLTVTSLPE